MAYLSAKQAARIKEVTPAAIYAAFDSGLLAYEIVADKKVTTEEALALYKPLRRHERKGVKLGPRNGGRDLPAAQTTIL